MRVAITTGLLLKGPTATVKTSVARLIVTQTNRSSYAITPFLAGTPRIP
jgi:hypothetical protein